MMAENNSSGRILVVDDEKDILRALEFILSREGYSVTTAVSGEEAIELLKKEEFDLVLTDLRMPGMDGMEVLEKNPSTKTFNYGNNNDCLCNSRICCAGYESRSE